MALTTQFSQRSIDDLKQECATLQRNNDRLVNVVAENNTSKHTITDLEKRLEYAKRSQTDKSANFKLVNDHLDKQLKKTQEDVDEAQRYRSITILKEKELKEKRERLKREQEELAIELKRLESDLTKKTKDNTIIAGQKIALDEDIKDLEAKIDFQKTHFELMKDALAIPDGEETSRPASRHDEEGFITKLLQTYADQFGKEYEKLMKKAQMREKEMLSRKLQELKILNLEKEKELQKLADEMKVLAEQIRENDIKIRELNQKLQELNKVKSDEQQNYDSQKSVKEDNLKRLIIENEKLKDQIEKSKKSANEAIKVICELQFEIKTYEKLLSIDEENTAEGILKAVVEDNNVGSSIRRVSESGKSSTDKSRSSSSSSSSSDSD